MSLDGAIEGQATSLAARAADVIPGGSSTGSKRPDALYGSRAGDPRLPTHFDRGEGCTLWSTDGRSYLDLGMALGAVAIGYGDPAVTGAVQEAAARGNVSALPHRLEVEVAEALVALVPCAEAVRFLRTGAEANAAAIRIARAATGRSRVIACGYFGWLDWCSDALGVPATTRDDVTWIPFDDVAALERAMDASGDDAAAVIVEPLVHDIASASWLQAIRDRCTRHGAVMILDEVKTGFRIRTGGVQELHRVIPDLTTLGKAMANGYPLAAVVGRAAVMESATRTWISSTAAAESTGLAAARAVCDWHDRTDVPARVAEAGRSMREIVGGALADAPWSGVRAEGPDAMWRLVSDTPDALDAFVAVAAHHGVLFKRGAYQFAALAHETGAYDILRRTMPSILDSLRPGVRLDA